ncbi:hypothetical protein J6590_069506 [Homalodisca vitripennis]|nr:hypothetical protein J6590_069506 [Homalodisca vitripennis]
MMWYGVWLCIGVVAATGGVQPSADNGTASETGATEIQRATCQVVTEKLVATASATVTHALKGVCATNGCEDTEEDKHSRHPSISTTDENAAENEVAQESLYEVNNEELLKSVITEDLEKHFLNLRSEVHNELTTIKILLLKINQEVANLHHALSPQVNKTCQTSNSEEGNPNIVVRGPRDSEINQYNATIHIDQNGNNVFSYFWRIVEIRSKIVQQTQAVLRSPSFYVNQQYRMYIKLLPHQDKGSVYVHVGLTHGHYDNLLPWPFRLRHRVSVVDQTLQEPQDLASRIWDPTVLCSVSDWRQPLPTRDNDECVGFGFTQSTIFSRDYVHNDSIILRLDVFLQ